MVVARLGRVVVGASASYGLTCRAVPRVRVADEFGFGLCVDKTKSAEMLEPGVSDGYDVCESRRAVCRSRADGQGERERVVWITRGKGRPWQSRVVWR